MGFGELNGGSSNSNNVARALDAEACVPKLHVVCGDSTPRIFFTCIFPVELKNNYTIF